MKYATILRLSVLVCSVLGMQQGAFAQEKTAGDWQIGFGAGYTNYFGDLSNYRIRGFRDFYKIYRFADYNKYYIDKPSLSVMIHKNITPTLGFMIQANTMSFAMSDRYRNKNGSFDTSSLHYSRSLNFRTSLQDAGIAFTFRTNNGKFLPENAFFSPSFFLGAGVSTFKVMGDLYDENNQPYNYRLPGNIQDGTFETNLRDQLTETDEKYRHVEPYVDLGLGLNFRFSDLITLSIQSDIKYSASDYLDDVSGKYKTSYATPQQQYIAKPGYNVVNPLSLQRGDDNGMDDFYINNRVVLSIGLGRKKVQKPFVAPAVYSLSMPYNLQQEKADSLKKKTAAYNDSVLVARNDSLSSVMRRNDSLRRSDSLRKVRDTTVVVRQDDSVKNELKSIRSELKEIKDLLRDQQVRPRYQQLQFQEDSLKLLQNKISTQRTITREDNLKLRIYQLQADSVRHEMEKLSTGKPPYGAYTTPGVEQRINTLPENSNTVYDTAIIHSAVKADTVSASEIRSYNDEIKQLKQDKRYKIDPAYRKSVDSLNKKLAVYDQQLRTVSQQQAAARPQIVKRDTVINVTNQKKIDSLQNRMNELQKMLNTKSSTDTSAYKQIRQEAEQRIAASKPVDTIAVNRNISQLENNLQISNDSVSRLKRQLQSSNDSITYYNKLASSFSDKEVSKEDKKTRWYQRLFSSKKPKDNTAVETAERDRLAEQQKYYQQQTDRTNQAMSDLEKRNRDLSDQYEDLVSSRSKWSSDGIVVQTPSPAVVYQNDAYRGSNYDNRNYNNELQSLRDEIDRLKGQVYNANQRNYDTYVPLTGQPSVVTVPVPVPTVPLGNSVQQPVTPVAVMQDTSAMQLLRSDLDQLRGQLDSIKNTKPVVTTREVITNQKFDVKSFPVVSVYFSSGSVALTNDQVKKITPFAQVAAKNPDATILLKGFTDPTGNPSVNQAIAKKRSEYVRNLLTTRFNISETRIAADEPSTAEAGKTKKPNPLDRRVDLEFN